MTASNEIDAQRLLRQAEWCQTLGSRLYSTLLHHAAVDIRAGGVCFAVLRDHHDDPQESALALRFLGAVHRLVLEGKAPQRMAKVIGSGPHFAILCKNISWFCANWYITRCKQMKWDAALRYLEACCGRTPHRLPAATAGSRGRRWPDPSLGPLSLRSG